MIDSTIPPLLLSTQASVVDADRNLQRRCARGEIVRIRRGVYVETAQWHSLSVDAQFRARVHAAAAALPIGTQFSHRSAAVLLHLPSLGKLPNKLEALGPLAHGGTSNTTLRRYAIGLDPEPERINRATVTSLARTAVDVARTSSFMSAVCTVDAALGEPPSGSFRALNLLPPLQHQTLLNVLAISEILAGAVRARRVIEFASGLAGSPGESVSRVHMHLMGMPEPELQVPFYDAEGLIGFADFYWRELDAIGEFDGNVKYLGTTYRRGRLPEQVVLDEKRREDRMRRVVRNFVRWDWPVAMNQGLLAARLEPAGILRRR